MYRNNPAARPSTPTTCPCGGYGVQIHPAWDAFWRTRNCPTDLAGHLILPPEEIPCACTQRVAA